MKAAEGATKGFNFALVAKFLPFGDFNEFQDILHLGERLTQRLDDLHHFIDCVADGRAIEFLFGGAETSFRRFDGGLGRFDGFNGRGKFRFRRFAR